LEIAVARYKVLKSVAHSMGHSFTSLMNYAGNDYVMGHLLRRAREVREPTLIVDILADTATPASLLTPEIRRSVSGYCSWFPSLLASHKTHRQFVHAARMTLTFDLGVERPARYAPGCTESPYVCHVAITDDRGKVWSAEIKDWWYPEPLKPAPGGTKPLGRRLRIIERLGQVITSIWTKHHLEKAAV
jgi:hypothetical protein